MTTGRVPRFPASDLSDDAPRAPDTLDELAPVLAVGSGDNPTIHVTPTDLRDSEWGRALEARLAAHDERWKWTKRIGVLLAPMVVTGFLTGLAWFRSSGIADGAAAERETVRADDHRLLRDLRDDIAEIRGELRAISRLGAVRLQGPVPQPLLPGDP